MSSQILSRGFYAFVSTAICLVCFSTVLAQPTKKKANVKHSEVSSDAVALFDGKSLDGWDGDQSFWRVEDGIIVGQSTPDNPVKQNTFLVYTKKEFSDFELNLRFKVKRGNSGIQFRSEVFDKDKFRVRGYQADIDPSMRYMGILYEEGGRGILAERGNSVTINDVGQKESSSLDTGKKVVESFKKDDWNQYTVIVKGNQITQKINGITSIQLTDNQSDKAKTKGVIALQLHVGPPMKIEFKDIEIKEFK